MRKLLIPVAGALLLAGALSPAAAVERGGELTFGRYADSLFLDPVLNDANVDIWILTNLYDTLIRSSPGRQGSGAGARDRVGDLRRRHRGDPHAARRRQVRRRLGHDRRGRQVVARSRPQSRERHLERPDRLDRQRRDRRRQPYRSQAQEPRSDHHPGARRVQHRRSCPRRCSRPSRARPTPRRRRPSPSIRSAPARSCSRAGSAARRCASCATRTTGSRARMASLCPISTR